MVAAAFRENTEGEVSTEKSFRKIHYTVFNRKHFQFWVNIKELLL